MAGTAVDGGGASTLRAAVSEWELADRADRSGDGADYGAVGTFGFGAGGYAFGDVSDQVGDGLDHPGDSGEQGACHAYVSIIWTLIPGFGHCGVGAGWIRGGGTVRAACGGGRMDSGADPV